MSLLTSETSTESDSPIIPTSHSDTSFTGEGSATSTAPQSTSEPELNTSNTGLRL